MYFDIFVDFSEANLWHLYNTDLVNQLGNLVQRISKPSFHQTRTISDNSGYSDSSHSNAIVGQVAECYDQYKFHHGIVLVMEMVRSLNAYVSTAKPWELVEDVDNLTKTMNRVKNELWLISNLLYPIIPAGAGRIMQRLGRRSDGGLSQKGRMNVPFPRI